MALDSETTLALPEATRAAAAPVEPALRGSVLVLIQFDVCEEIRLDQLRQIFGARTMEQPSFKHSAPSYVRYQRPPVVEPLDPLILDSGERLEGQIKYYDYGVLSVVFELPFSGDWETLVRLGSRWVWDVDFEKLATRIVREKLERAAPALVKPYPEWLSEDYFIFHVREIEGSPSANELCASQRRAHRANCAWRNRSALRWRTQRNPAVPHVLLPQRPRCDRLERGFSLRQ